MVGREKSTPFSLYVEGGGKAESAVKCREGFREFLKKAGLQPGAMPRIFASGSRTDAYDAFCTALNNGEKAYLLVDSEGPVPPITEQNAISSPWGFLITHQEDQWSKPKGATEDQCHLMVQCMENWFLADLETLQQYYGKDFQSSALPKIVNNVESIPKQDVLKILEKATRNTQKEAYSKGKHSFELLKRIDSKKVTAASPWAMRFVNTLCTNVISSVQ